MVDSDISEMSEFNMTFSLFYRVNYLFYQANSQAQNLDLYGWFHTILALYREVSPLIKKEKENYENIIKGLIPQFQDIKTKMENKQPFNIDFDIYKKLMDFEIALRQVMQDNKMYISQKKDRSFGIS